MSIGSKGTVIEPFSAVTIGFVLPNTNRGNKRYENSSDWAYEQQGAKLTLQLAWLAGKELVTVPQY